ncbi:MAG: RagB/SusD family nutrient uptake outer membrane protein [Bacteroidales bacterium]|nr:RagB/SusD family nutrient uptake outer membrane protein [Bacteroidales bacterium]MBN2749100.1 RagB/SusD family nutrient uptake outer membrane protein [Bacteroidales bacterium]
MKLKYIVFLCFSLLFVSCDKFLEEESQDLIVPKSVQDYRELLFGEGYLRGTTPVNLYLDIMTDDVADLLKAWGFGGDMRLRGFGYYAWQPEPENQHDGVLFSDDAWDRYYHSILIANIILNEVDGAKGSLAEKESIKGEAYFIRAYSYFMLVNLYAKPYNAQTASSDLGVPINLNHGAQDKVYVRETVQKVYNQITSDVNSSIALLDGNLTNKTFFRVNATAARLLAARVHLFMKQYELALKYAQDVIRDHPTLYDIRQLANGEIFISFKNPEIIFSYGAYDSYNYYYSQLAKGKFVASSEFLGLYQKADLRKAVFFVAKLGKYYPFKSDEASSIGAYGKAFRSAEAYLIKAEALAETNDYLGAIETLNYLRQYRFSAPSPLSASNRDEAIELVRRERRMEMSFEDLRWFDLRRWGQPSITHTFTDPTTKVVSTFKLEEGDAAYVLPIPQKVMEGDPNLVNNQRPGRLPVTQ